MINNRPTIGVALSGGASRAMAHIAVLEVFKENNIPVDYLIGCSSGAIVAVTFASNKMEELKQWFYSADFKKILSLWSIKNAKGGIFHLRNADELLADWVGGITFETSYPKLGLVASDLRTWELITLSMGDMITAMKASCAVPGLFEPVVWGEKILVDGGLASIVPTQPLKDMGADIVIGINISPAKFIYEKKLPYWKRFRQIINLLGFSLVMRTVDFSRRFYFKLVSEPGLTSAAVKVPRSYKVLIEALNRSVEISEQFK